ncbi:TonB-dependent receptor [Fulvivirga sp. RKSG066]|uniref:SusC/RagA family TonB-linked outer membrane protein n=1 Tax=Fulvivirga aurantia TaxID=2529383 RepID=UPI0012BD69CF|nr:TonB-dependent receptor [Fulvivirga aurantia]MTI21141.1 TonB-dependent receptor [Fulvivirga aurantia]
MKKFLLLSFMLMFAFTFSESWAQERTVSGKVTSVEDGSTLPGVNVVVKGTTTGTVTDIDGNYKLTVPSSASTLVFSFIGLATEEIEIGTRSVIDVAMSPDVQQLSEVVVVGYGTTLKKEFTGSSVSVSSKQIEKLPVTGADQVLQGLAAGVQVTSASGTPGGGISVRVRGQTSISASNDPLYVIDGVPVVSGNIQQSGFGGQGGNALSALNPNDIESIEVLKDASSTAIYGARAANGVVLITTKRGKTGKTKLNAGYMRGFGEPTNVIDVLNADQWEMIMNEARLNDGLAPVEYDETPNANVDTDWLDEVFRTADIEQFNLSLSGGDSKTRYFVSGSYRNEQGTMLGSGYQRATTRLNLDHTATEKFSFGASIGLSFDKNERIQNDNNIYGVLSTALLTAPNIPVFVLDENGNPTDEYSDEPPFANPVRSALLPRFDNKTKKVIANTYYKYEIVSGVTAQLDASLDWTELTEDHYIPASTFQGAPNGVGNYNTRELATTVLEPTLRINKTLGSDHNISAVVGGTWQNRTDFRNSVSGNGFSRESLTYLTSASTITAGSSLRRDYAFNSVFARASYSYQGKYLATATVRRDGSSRFGPDNRFGTFYAFSVGWNFSDESFMDGIEWLSLGKLRASYGKTGNDRIGDFTYLGTWTGGANYLDRPATAPVRIANNELKWEETTTYDIGLELALFNNRLNINAGYFDGSTVDLLYANPIPESTGFASVQDNIGEIRNWGWEFDVNSVNVNTNGFKWSTTFNISFLDNEVVSLLDPEPILSGFGSAIIEGEPLNTFYLYDFIGVDPATGNSMYTDVDGNGTINSEDQTIVGNYQPDFLGGITNSFSYKGISLDVFFQFIQGVDVYNNNRQFMEHLGTSAWGMDASVLRRWRQPGDITDIPRAATGATVGLNNADNSRFLEDGSYLRLKNVTLGYDFPQNLVSKYGLGSLRLYVTGQNLLTFTEYSGFDPEVNVFNNTSTAQGTDFLTYPQSKMLLVGINVGL